jgi:hypothetical protein
VEVKRGTRFFILNDKFFYFSLMLWHHSAFLQEFRNWESAWAMQALHTIVYDLRTVAELADKEITENGKMPDKLKGAGSFLMKVFGALAVSSVCQLFILLLW